MKRLLMWEYCRNLNDINDAIIRQDKNWEGLTNASQIISITWDDSIHNYVVFWTVLKQIPREGLINGLDN